MWLAAAAVAASGCGEDEPAKAIDVARGDGGASDSTASFCGMAADHMMTVCGAAACEGGVTGPACREQMVKACEMDLHHADGVFKYMCRRNSLECAVAKACTI